MRSKVIVALSVIILALGACDDREVGELQPDPAAASAPAPTASPAPEAALRDPDAEDADAEPTVIEVDPEIGGAEPMDAAAPMADAAPMSEEFGSEPQIETAD